MFPIHAESKKNNTREKSSALALSTVDKMQSLNQPAKLFDNKFVVTVLRNTRCCPKCRSEYSTNYDLRMGDLHVKSNRPFLLSCGHNMCENCIYQNHQNLVCSVCQIPIVIEKRNNAANSPNSHAIQQKQQRHYTQPRHENFNVRDYFYMNFFLMGELNHLRFYRRESSANNTLMISDRGPPSPTSSGNRTLAPGIHTPSQRFVERCTECELEPAVGLCRQCTVHYCRVCYDSIHMYGKALKRHSLVALDKDRQAAKEAQLPRPAYCQQHRRAKDRYCHTCQLICCYVCVQRMHKTHHGMLLVNENEGLQDEIGTILESVKMSRENLRKSQKEVKAIELQLEEYATQCLKDISEYFLQLHSFLQNEEARILEDFHNQCVEPQKIIRDAFSKLGETQSILNKMRTQLEQYQQKVPTDIYLRQVFDIYNTQLEEIDCRAQISKLTKSPFIFEVKQDLRKDFSQCYAYQYVDPKITVRLQPIYGDMKHSFSDRKSDSSDQMDVDCYIEKHKRKNNERNKKKKQEKLRYDGNEDASNSRTSDVESQGHLLRDKELVRISYVKSPEHFYVQTKNAIHQIRELSNKYVNFMQTDIIPKVITEGQYYMAYHNDDKQWYRGMVKKILTNDLYKVFLVDIGMQIEVPKGRFCEIDSKSLNIPFAAIRCAIHDIIPVGKSWNEEATNLLVEITNNHFVRVSIVERIKENMLSVDLITTSGEEAISVRESFLYTGLAREMSGASNMPSPLKKISPMARTNQRLPKYSFHNGDMLIVKVTNIESPHMFYVMKLDAIEMAQRLKSDLNFQYNQPNETLQPVFLALAQMCCAVRIEDIWHRARVEEIHGGGKISVHLVDEGSQHEVNWRQIFPLINKFRAQKEFTIKCALADIEPLQENSYAWTSEAIREFSQLAANPTLQMTILSTNEATIRVTLHVCKKHMDINIGAMLVNYGHCVATGESSQVVEVYKTPKKRVSLPTNTLTDATQFSQGNTNVKGKDVPMQDVKETVNTAGVATKSDKPVKVLKRTPVKVVHVVDPGEFYIQIASLTTGIAKFHNQLQQAQNEDQSNTSSFSLCSQSTNNWFVGNHCLVNTKYKSDLTKQTQATQTSSPSEWYRAIIIAIKADIEADLYTVFLRDIGATISDITSAQLRVIDHQWDRVTNAVHRCHLACIEPTGGTTAWSHSAIDCFKHTVGSFESLSATLQGKRLPGSNSLPIVLWGTITETEDPLAPCITKHSIINRILVKAGLAYSVQRLDVTEQLDKLLEMEFAEGEITMEEWNNNFMSNAALKEIDHPGNAFKAFDSDNSMKTDDHDTNVIPEIDFTLDLVVDSQACGEPTVFTSKAPEAWLQSKPINKSIFVAIPTYVDYEAIVYLHDAYDKDLLKHLREIIMKTYGEYEMPTTSIPVYTPGQACLVRYHVDKRLYRGIVQKKKKDDFIVQFIDYGNVESVKLHDLLPFAPFPKLPRIANKYRIEGIRAKSTDGVYTTDVLDIIHVTVVEKLVSIRVASAELQNPIKACSMRLGNMDVAEYLISGGHVERDILRSDRSHKKNKKNTRDKFKPSYRDLKAMADIESTTDNNDELTNEDKALPVIEADKMFQFKHFKSDFFELNEDNKSDEDADNDDDNDDTVNDCLDQLIYNLDKGDNHSDSDDSPNDELNNALSPLQAAQAAQLALQQHQKPTQHSFTPPCKKRMFDSNEYKQLHKQMLLENLYGSENFMKNELAAMQSDNDVAGADGALATSWGLGEDDEDAAIVELEQSFALNYWHTTDETERQKDKNKDKEMEKTKELGKNKEIELETHNSVSVSQRSNLVMETSAFDRFYPNETSSVFSHFSGIECFKMPQIPVGKRSFECSVVSIVTPTIVQILPHLTEFEYRELELQRRIKHLVKSAPMLTEYEPRTICLSQYQKDKKWYRALIRSHNPVAKQVDVLFVDYLNTASVSITHLKQCPLELISWPLRTIRARLHGLVPNPRLREKDIRQALQNIVLKRTLVARIVKEPKRLDNSTAISMTDFMRMDDVGDLNSATVSGAMTGSGPYQHNVDDIMEVHLYDPDIYARKQRDARIYQPLIQDSFYSYKKV
ncbi:RING finger protein 17 [Bactrocera dorsalis]|uniref:RING finger protein 17 n=1 Tax=Bactrocera dorsalis TaxID=27457 RepID=A0ABM3J3E2_BACDO|nr:RING finger protein 17 [Bactrocera dorsalis]